MMTLPSLVLNLPTRWRHLKIQIKCSIGSNFGHLVALPALFPNLPTRWRHHLVTKFVIQILYLIQVIEAMPGSVVPLAMFNIEYWILQYEFTRIYAMCCCSLSWQMLQHLGNYLPCCTPTKPCTNYCFYKKFRGFSGAQLNIGEVNVRVQTA